MCKLALKIEKLIFVTTRKENVNVEAARLLVATEEKSKGREKAKKGKTKKTKSCILF